jgi:protein-disulfide isomerase
MTMARNIWFLLAFVLAAGLTVPGATPAGAETSSKPDSQTAPKLQAQATAPDAAALAPRKEGEDMVMGNAKASVTIIEYASLTCPHCAHFDEETFPQLKSEYIDKGLVKYVYRDFPLDRVALQAAQIARCSGPDRYFGFIDVLFRQQQNWAASRDPNQITENLRKLARLGGMSDDTFNKCLNDKAVQDAVLTQQLKGEQEFKVNSTPTLIINGKTYPGALTFEELDKVLKPMVGKS